MATLLSHFRSPWLKRALRRVFALLAAAALAAGSLFAVAAPASAADTAGTPNAYAYNNTAPGTSFTATITVNKYPGQMANVYWSNQFSMGTGNAGYIGLQTSSNSGGRVLMSIWNSTACRQPAGGVGICDTFVEGGSGARLNYYLPIVEGNTYQYTVSTADGLWWRAELANLTTHTNVILGELYVPNTSATANTIRPWVQWLEYFDWNNPNATVEAMAASRATITAPIMNGVQSRITGTKGAGGTQQVSADRATVTFDTNPGNSARGTLTTSALPSLKLDVQGGIAGPGQVKNLGMLARDGLRQNENYVFAFDGTLRSFVPCVTADSVTGVVTAQNCTGASNQQWRALSSGELYNLGTASCLTSPGANNVYPIKVAACTAGANQIWVFPAHVTTYAPGTFPR